MALLAPSVAADPINLPTENESTLPVVQCAAHAFVNGDEIALADVARIDTSDRATDRALRDVYLGTSPRIGRQRQLSREYIVGRITQSGIETSSLNLQVPPSVTIEREARTVSREELAQIAERLLPGALPHDTDHLILENVRVMRELLLPPGDYEWEVSLTGNRRALGPISFEIAATENGERAGRAVGNAQVDVETSLIEAVAEVPRGTLISPEHVREVRGTQGRAPNGALTDQDCVIGQVATQRLAPGSLVTERMVATPKLVKRGEVITMIFESGGLRITDRAVATQDGAAGDLVVVQNLQSQRSVRALVTGERTVRVLY
jgi:flagella basal body P-ring formation protein FlgA